jgi:hypothetical protein
MAVVTASVGTYGSLHTGRVSLKWKPKIAGIARSC